MANDFRKDRSKSTSNAFMHHDIAELVKSATIPGSPEIAVFRSKSVGAISRWREESPKILSTNESLGPLKIDAISPMTGETTKSPGCEQSEDIAEPPQPQGDDESHHSEFSFVSENITTSKTPRVLQPKEEIGSPVSSTLYPLKYNKSLNGAVFEEAPITALTGPSLHEEKGDDGLSKKTLTTLIILSLLVILLALGYIPMELLRGQISRNGIRKYFEKGDLPLLQELAEKYGVYGDRPQPQLPPLLNQTTTTVEVKPSSTPIFHGVAYSPQDVMEPECGASFEDIVADVKTLASVTTRLRNYGMQCNQSSMILSAIQHLQVPMKLSMGVWIGQNDTVNQQQLAEMKRLLQIYPSSLFEYVFIGNEVLFRGDQSEERLIEYIVETREYISSLGYSIPVGTSELGSLASNELLANCDVFGANVHPFFGGESVEKAAEWTVSFIKYQIEPFNRHCKIVVSEVGWPSGGGQYLGAEAGVENLKRFVQDWVCQISNSGYEWYFFEAFDEPWKKMFYEGNNTWETQWGIFTSDRASKLDMGQLRFCWEK